MSETVVVTQAALFGGVTIPIKRIEQTVGGPALMDDTILVRKLPVRLMQDWLKAQDKEGEMVAMACSKDAAWVETLSDDSFKAVLEKAEELNADFLAQYWSRRMTRQERLLPGFYGKVISQATATAASATPPSSPT